MTTGGRRGVLTALALAATVAGTAVLGVAFAEQEPAPPTLDSAVGTPDAPPSQVPSQPSTQNQPSSGQQPSAEAEAPDDRPEVQPRKDEPLPPSRPVSITIPSIDVRSEVFPIGKAKDGSLRVPQPGPRLDKAAWYNNSPTPGQPGPSVIEGHVATEQSGPSVFFELAEVRPGDKIKISRTDRTTVVFTAHAVREYAKDRFPTELVYGGSLGKPTLRLITCTNFDESTGSHIGNLIVFAHLTDVRRADR